MTTDGSQSMLEGKPLLMLMDGHALVHRAWHAIREPLTVSATGEDVSGVYGFVNSLIRSLQDWEPTHCAIAFDLPAPTFRHKRFKDYKAHRPPTPPELRSQFERVRQLIDAFEIPIYQCEGYEADDMLGTLCRQAEEQEIETVILTGDSDTLQLVSPWVRVFMANSIQQAKVYDVAGVKERFGGLGPEAVADIKALQGDSSDNIPGVPGVGIKTAVNLVSKFGEIEEIIAHVDEVTPPRAQRNIREGVDQLRESKVLTTIVKDVPVTLDLEASRFWQYDRSKVVGFLTELEFLSVVPRIPVPSGAPVVGEQQSFDTTPDAPEVDYRTVDTPEGLETLVNELNSPLGFAFDTETTAVDAMSAELVGLSFSNTPHTGWYVPVGHNEGQQLPMDGVLEALRPVFESETVPKTAHNANYDMTILKSHGVEVRGVTFDTMIAAALLGRRGIGLKQLALNELGVEMTELSDLIGTGRSQITMAEVPIHQAAEYAAADADLTWQLRPRFERELEAKNSTRAMQEVEMPLLPVLVRMQESGVSVDAELLTQMSQKLGANMARIQDEMYLTVGRPFNLNSAQQLSDVLFNQLRLPPTKKRQRGFATDAASLEGLKATLDAGRGGNVDPAARQVLDSILEYRQLSKIKSTYTDSLPGLVNQRTGRIHTSYNQVGSATGRVSSNDPNIQNIPVRTELGNEVRKGFVARDWPEWTLLGADYSQIELRILAHISQDPALLQAFHDGQDIHAATASLVYGVSHDEVDAEMRRVAKILNFGVVYGISPYGISQRAALSVEEGKAFIDTYFGSYPGISDYIGRIKSEAKSRGYVETLMGRKRYIPEINARNFAARSGAERVAINTPIQGTAADVIKLAMVMLQNRIDEMGLRSLMIIQVHDELIFEVPSEEMEDVQAIVLDIMPRAMELAVPLDVDLKSGQNWGVMA
ncbi:MAG: DNA polymerase I [Chloroflexi bacterium]|nr:DNA polymerase I [Chloroflexota bacterium]